MIEECFLGSNEEAGDGSLLSLTAGSPHRPQPLGHYTNLKPRELSHYTIQGQPILSQGKVHETYMFLCLLVKFLHESTKSCMFPCTNNGKWNIIITFTIDTFGS